MFCRQARNTKAGKKYKNRRGRLIIMKLIKRAGPPVILGPSGRNTRIPSFILHLYIKFPVSSMLKKGPLPF